MRLEFDRMPMLEIEKLQNGEGTVLMKRHMDEHGKIMLIHFPKGVSTGYHQHVTNGEIMYVLSGQGIAVCDGEEELLLPGICHYCPKGHFHQVTNTGEEDLVVFALVPEYEG